MKIKIIDLLNMIAKGEEVPKKIKYRNYVFEWNEGYRRYYHISNSTFGGCLSLDGILNDEVEIIEDKPKEIEKFQVKDGHIIGKWENGSDYRYTLSAPQTVLALKMLEIIDKVNEMSKND